MKYSLVGCGGSAFSIIGYVSKCMKRERKTREEINVYVNKATDGDYSHLLAVSRDMIDELNEGKDDDDERDERVWQAILTK